MTPELLWATCAGVLSQGFHYIYSGIFYVPVRPHLSQITDLPIKLLT